MSKSPQVGNACGELKSIIMIEVFRTNVAEPRHAAQLVNMLLEHFPDGKINFDLQDCDRILRIDKQGLVPEKVIRLMQESGYECHILD